jgi:hypothetical protein
MGGFDRLMIMSDMGGLGREPLLETLEMFSADVMPIVRKTMAGDEISAVAAA